jgi:hypothetical protein
VSSQGEYVLNSKGIAAGLLILTLSIAASAQKQNATSAAEQADEAAIRDYVLTMPKLQAYAAASRDFGGARKDPGLEAEAKRLEDNEKASILEKIKLVETSCPHISAWIKQHGMTPRDFFLTPMTLMTVGIAEMAKQQGGNPPDFISPANLQFYKQHKTEIEKLDIKNDEERKSGSDGSDSQ